MFDFFNVGYKAFGTFRKGGAFLAFALGLFCFAFLLPAANAQTVTLTVVGPDEEPVPGFRWQLEEDISYHPVPGQNDPEPLSINFHRSYAPIFAKGDVVGNTAVLPVDPAKHYFVSILPAVNPQTLELEYTIGGTTVSPGQADVKVVVNTLPLPTAQCSILVFNDTSPINNAPNLPADFGLIGFTVLLFDAGGRYGASGGQLFVDAFGNPLGTTYNPDGTVKQIGNSIIKTDRNGEVLIQNLAPGKYGVQIVPPEGQGWQQTTTIEGSKTIDVWIKAGEPPHFMEFGPPGYHAFFGFVQPFKDTNVLNGSNKVSGRVTNLHLSRPPDPAFHRGEPAEHTTAWIGLNEMSAGIGTGVYAGPADADGNFEIDSIPPGTYELVVWDENLDFIMGRHLFTVTATGGDIDFGDVPVFQWFTRLENFVFFDTNENGFRDPGEPGIPEQAVTIRFRDGSVYNSMPTDLDGYVPFDEIFPFFNWLVAEVDFARYKATGVTVTVDGGGKIDPNDPRSFGGKLSPQLQPENNDNPWRTETGEVLTQAFQGFLGQTSVLEWGKSYYNPGENGGISGIVFYAVTRAENDPRFAAAEEWEPGIPRVQVNLYQDADLDKIIDDLDGDGGPTLADVDNHPFGNFPGPEDVDRNYPHQTPGDFDAGDAIQISTTDSWDDNLPANCPGDPLDPFYKNGKGFDGMRIWNQVRPGVFDGGYAFNSYFPDGIESGSSEVDGLPSGVYIVEAVPPRSPEGETYEILKEEHKNVDFGDTYEATPDALPPECVGDLRTVPAELTLFPGVPAPFAGTMRPLSDRKQIFLSSGQNAAADFFMCTNVPPAAHVVGFVLNDLANEFDPYSPQFGEKFAPAWLPITFRDFTGRVILRTYSDQWGKYNALLPSTFTANIPSPSGFSPNMLTVLLNDPGPIPDPDNPGQFIIDPYFNPQYSQYRYTFQYMPGSTTYLDTPVLPIAAFAGPDQFPLDAEFITGTPRIHSVSGPGGGPYVSSVGERITIKSMGPVDVLNPYYEGPEGAVPRLIERDYGFGDDTGIVTIGGMPLVNVSWSDSEISGDVAAGTETGQLVVTRDDNELSTITSVTVTVGFFGGSVHHVTPSADPKATPIQDAIDGAQPGDLVLVAPGLYSELVILWKPLYLQGWGPGSTMINAVKAPSEKLIDWRTKVDGLIAGQFIDLLPGQENLGAGIEPAALQSEQGAAIVVLAKDTHPVNGGFGLLAGSRNSRIDGFTITGADLGGGIAVNGYAHYLEISNNRVTGNQGFYGGGIRSGHPFLTGEVGGSTTYLSCQNDHLFIHNNHITRNGGLGAAGGGLTLCSGSDLYEVTNNVINGNFTMGDGGGIGAIGMNPGGLIAHNIITFNQSFNQTLSASGGGIFVGGGAPLNGPGSLSEGTGSLTIDSNLILGNNSGAGDGGGIRLSRINGQDVANQPNGGGRLGRIKWHRANIMNNIIVNNVAGLAGGGISLQDAVYVTVLENTIANNDSTATAGGAFSPGSPLESTLQPAGIAGRAHSSALAGAFGVNPVVFFFKDFSNPILINSIIHGNRSFWFKMDNTGDPPAYRILPDLGHGGTPIYWDLGVLGVHVPRLMNPRRCILTDKTGYHPSNIEADPEFLVAYVNTDRGQTLGQPEPKTGIQVGLAFDEGGNFIDVRYGPLTRTKKPAAPGAPAEFHGDYHIKSSSPAVNKGWSGFDVLLKLFKDVADRLDDDVDGQDRPPTFGKYDIGADERPDQN